LPLCSQPQPVYSNILTIPSPLPDHFKPGDSITFRCTTGYILNGVSVITCQDDGQWNSNLPTCTAVSCCVPPSFPNAYHTNFEYTYPNMVYYYCNDGYYHSGGGTPYKQCLDYGRWSVGIEPQCTAISTSLQSTDTSEITQPTRQNELSDQFTGIGDTLKYSSTPIEGSTVIRDTTFKPSVPSSGNEEEKDANQCNQKDANTGVYVGFGIVIVVMAVVILTLVLLYRRARLKSTRTEEKEMTNLDKSNDRTYQDLITTDTLTMHTRL
ncbi:membrane cofactor protein-like, partial [Saccoglossus kowalevskii]